MKALGMILLLAGVALSSGCAYGKKMQELRPEMSREEVVGKLGNPDGVRQVGDFTVYTYFNRLVSGWAWDRADYHVIFDAQDRVVEYGPGEIRVRENNTVLIVPLNAGG